MHSNTNKDKGTSLTTQFHAFDNKSTAEILQTDKNTNGY